MPERLRDPSDYPPQPLLLRKAGKGLLTKALLVQSGGEESLFAAMPIRICSQGKQHPCSALCGFLHDGSRDTPFG